MASKSSSDTERKPENSTAQGRIQRMGRPTSPFDTPQEESVGRSTSVQLCDPKQRQSVMHIPPATAASSRKPRSISDYALRIDSKMTRSYSLPDGRSAIIAPGLPAPPYPVEKYHFFLLATCDLIEIVPRIATFFRQQYVEFSFSSHKCKFKCLRERNFKTIQFVLRIYTTKDDLFLVECQRRHGSLLEWDEFYHSFYQEMAPFINAAVTACSQSPGQKRVVSDNHKNWKQPAQFEPFMSSSTTGMEAMKLMIYSKYEDAQCEACRCLADLTRTAANALSVADAGLVVYFVESLESSDDHKARCCVAVVANIADALGTLAHGEQRNRIAAQLEVAVPRILKRDSLLQNGPCKVEFARALRSIRVNCLNEARLVSDHRSVERDAPLGTST